MADFIGFIGVLLLLVAIFFICRALFLWYWRITDIINNQEAIKEKLDTLIKVIEKQADNIKELNQNS